MVGEEEMLRLGAAAAQRLRDGLRAEIVSFGLDDHLDICRYDQATIPVRVTPGSILAVGGLWLLWRWITGGIIPGPGGSGGGPSSGWQQLQDVIWGMTHFVP